MRDDVLYFDTSYLAMLYLEDPGFQHVRDLASPLRQVVSSWHAPAELISALHRAYRERRLGKAAFVAVLDQMDTDCAAGLFHWIKPDDKAMRRLMQVYREANDRVYLRAADAIHLATASEAGFRAVYSSDNRLLEAATLFGLQGRNVLK